MRDLDGRQSEAMPGPSLDRIRAVADLLDHPELTYPTAHITGTNGKTTTARLVTAVACAHGLTTGTFISPHVTAVTERLSICGRPISEEEFGEEYEHLLPYLERVDRPSQGVTYFETLTGLAYLWFADKPVQLGVFEVGMGGTWDATNLIRGDVALLCPVGIDHKELGSTVAEVATEKAGIIKEGSTAVVREQRPEALAVIESRCREMDATMLLEGRDFGLVARAQAVGGQAIDVRGVQASYGEIYLPLYGEQAARNAALSIVAIEALLGRTLDERAVRTGLAGATSPGRIEVVGRHPLVVLDGAHNIDAMTALVQALPESFRWRRLLLVMGMFADKEIERVAAMIAPLADRAWAVPNSSPRTAPPERMADALRLGGAREVQEAGSVEQAVAEARVEALEGDLILVTGSFYTVADARPLLVGA